jgi:hypothetical protein
MPPTAYQDGHRKLFHWQALNETRLADSLARRTVYCSKPGDFNDPWDCKPFFNTEILRDQAENERHIAWAVDICRRRTPMSEDDIEKMRSSLRNDLPKTMKLIRDISDSMAAAIDRQYRVYCLGPDVGNLLMWSHYADSHKGVCLEFDLRNDVMCGALRCEYLDSFPFMRLHDPGDEQNLRILLAKANPWSYEKEYRLVSQERADAVNTGTLLTEGGFLTLPEGALVSVIVGCQGDYDRVLGMVETLAPNVKVKRAVRVPNQYAIEIVG